MIYHNLVFKQSNDPSDAKNKLDIYLPENVMSGPLLIYVHGGNFCRVDQRSMANGR